MEYSASEKIEIVLDIINKLKNFKGKNKTKINLYNDNYSFVPEFRKICNDYIRSTNEYRGTLRFEEIDRNVEYYLPVRKKDKAVFVIKINT
jgi:hypothetical protein